MRQFLLFRDLDDPDLWLGTDGAGRWGEINGAHRPELDGCIDIAPRRARRSPPLPIRRLRGSHVGEAAQVRPWRSMWRRSASPADTCYERLDSGAGRFATSTSGEALVEFDVDEHGVRARRARAFRRA